MKIKRYELVKRIVIKAICDCGTEMLVDKDAPSPIVAENAVRPKIRYFCPNCGKQEDSMDLYPKFEEILKEL